MGRAGCGFLKRMLTRKAKITFGSDCHTHYAKNCFEYFDFILKHTNIEEDVLKIG